MVSPTRFEVYLVNLDPTIGSEINKTRPCVVVSPDDLNNSSLNTIIVAPMTTKFKHYSFRVNLRFEGKPAQVALDQLKTVNRQRLKKKLNPLTLHEGKEILSILQEMFAI